MVAFAQKGHEMYGYCVARLARTGLAAALFLVAAIAWSGPGAAPAAALEVTAARIGVHPGVTRFVLEFDQRVAYRLFLLDSPYRVVIDMPESSWAAGPAPQGRTMGVIASYRHGLFQTGVTRVVIDTNVPVRVKNHFRLLPTGKAAHRIVLDLEEIDAAAFAAQQRKTHSPDWEKYQASLAAPGTERPRPPRRVDDPRKIIVLDPGHGGPDPGGIGATGTYEKAVVLQAARVIKRRLEASGRYSVQLTRNRDVFLSLRDRYKVAHQAGADLFVSLHADKIGRRDVRGLSVYTLSNKASDKEAAALAKKENKADIIAGTDLSIYEPDVSSILIDLAQESTVRYSRDVAETMVKELAKDVRVLRNTHRYAGFAVLKSPNVPSVLMELGYLSNRRDEKLLKQESYHVKVAEGLLRALDAYFLRQAQLSRT